MAVPGSDAVAVPADQASARLAAARLHALGWTCETFAWHVGSDIVCTARDEKAVVRCAGEQVGIDDVRHAAAVRDYHAAGSALIVHQGQVAAQVRTLSSEAGIPLVHLDELVAGSRWDRSEQGARQRLEREIGSDRDGLPGEDAQTRRTLMAYYQALNAYESDHRAWVAATRRHPWVRALGALIVLPPFLLIGSGYFLYVMASVLALAVYAVFFARPGPEPVAPAPPDATARQLIRDDRAPLPPRMPPPDREGLAGLPARRAAFPPGPAGRGAAPPTRSIVKCPKCRTRMRLPRGKRVTATCPACRHKFRADT